MTSTFHGVPVLDMVLPVPVDAFRHGGAEAAGQLGAERLAENGQALSRITP